MGGLVSQDQSSYHPGQRPVMMPVNKFWRRIFVQAYQQLMEKVLAEGVLRGDRTGVGTRGIFGHQMRFDLQAGLPVLTTKKIHVRSVILELLWFLSGSTNIRWLQQNGCKIWDPWADQDGELGPVYGHQWRSWPKPGGGSIDQIKQVLETITSQPDSRRMLVVAWNPSDLERMALPPCHCLFQFWVAQGRLSCQLYQRSCDVFIGLGFNIASYAILTHMVAAQTGLDVGEFIWTGGDIHLYENHLEQARLQIQRPPRPLPRLELRGGRSSIFDYTLEDFILHGYDPHPHIPAPVAV